jgi:hypothetical protein
MTRTSRRRLTRLDREAASRAAVARDIRPAGRAIAAAVAIGLLALAAGALTPAGQAFGGPVQGPVTGSTTFTAIRKTGGSAATLGIPVPWNAGSGTVVLEALAPIGVDGVEVERAGVAPPGTMVVAGGRGFPPAGVTLLPVDGFTVRPGTGPLDGFQVIVGLAGEGTVDGFALSYRVGGASYVAILPDGAMLCAAACRGRAEAEDEQRSAMGGLASLIDVPGR